MILSTNPLLNQDLSPFSMETMEVIQDFGCKKHVGFTCHKPSPTPFMARLSDKPSQNARFIIGFPRWGATASGFFLGGNWDRLRWPNYKKSPTRWLVALNQSCNIFTYLHHHTIFWSFCSMTWLPAFWFTFLVHVHYPILHDTPPHHPQPPPRHDRGVSHGEARGWMAGSKNISVYTYTVYLYIYIHIYIYVYLYIYINMYVYIYI